MVEKGQRDEKGRFVEGWEGGPGRPKFSIIAKIRDKLNEVPEGYREQYTELLVDRYIRGVLENNDGVAIRDLIDRFDGKPKQSLSVENQREADLLEYLRELDNRIYAETVTNIRGVPEGETEDTDT